MLPPYGSCFAFELRGPAARDDVMQRYGVDRDSLVEAFGTARDDWMASDFQGWLGANGFYEVRVPMCRKGIYSDVCPILVGVGGFCFFFCPPRLVLHPRGKFSGDTDRSIPPPS